MSYLTRLFNGNTAPSLVRKHDKEPQLRHDLTEYGRMLHAQGFVAATDGNLSVRLDRERVLITPTGFSKGMMEPEDMVVVDLHGKKLSGFYNPSSEIVMHLTIYRMRPDVGAVVHAHPCTATGFASAGIALDQPLCSEIVITLGAVPLAPYATTGTMELSESLEPFIPYHDAILNFGNYSNCFLNCAISCFSSATSLCSTATWSSRTATRSASADMEVPADSGGGSQASTSPESKCA